MADRHELGDSERKTIGEVTGGCFCCKLSDLTRAIEELHTPSPEVMFAEPVCSCTDNSTPILHSLLEYRDDYRLAPFTVLADPKRAHELLHADAEPNLSFLFRNQLPEADLICFTKSDLYSYHPSISAQQARDISATTGQGVAAWLNEILSGDLKAGSKILDIDCTQYARAEAALVWLNLQVSIEPQIPLSPAIVLGPLLDHLDAKLTRNNISILHLKTITDSPTGFVKAAICGNGQGVRALADSPASKHDLLLNLRALGEAVRVREIVVQELERTDGELIGLHLDCFHPAAPKPERRVAKAN